MNIKIRKLKKQELSMAAQIFVVAFNKVGEPWNFETALIRLQHKFKGNAKYFIGAFVDSKLVGFLAGTLDYVYDHKELYIDIFAVDPSVQGKGVGKLILQRAEAIAKENSLATVWLQASAKLPSGKFYADNGYKSPSWQVVYKVL